MKKLSDYVFKKKKPGKQAISIPSTPAVKSEFPVNVPVDDTSDQTDPLYNQYLKNDQAQGKNSEFPVGNNALAKYFAKKKKQGK